MAEYYRSRIIKQRIITAPLAVVYVILATLAYGHSYSNSEYQKYPGYESLSTYGASVAAILAPAYWLSVAGVWVFEEPTEIKVRPNPFEGVD